MRLLLVGAVAALAAAAPATADDRPFVNWPALLPALAPPFTESTFETCRDGSPSCLDHTLRELRRRIAAHDATCSDNALFPRNYRVVTEFYQRLAGTGFFADDTYVAREDAIFAELFFAAEDAWARGELDKVPEAWRIAFDAAERKEVQGAGNLLLGINAHVQLDQPYMIAGLGLVAPDGSSRKADHDKFNELLNLAYDDVIAQAIEWDDPDLAMYDVPGTQADNFSLFQIIATWREGVWRNAERLVGARSDAERRLVAESIERNAAEWANWIRREFRYGGPFTRTKRDALCAKRAERAAAERAAMAPERRDDRRRQVGCTAKPRAIGRRIEFCGRPTAAISRRTRDGRCRFVTRGGRLGGPRPCRRPVRVRLSRTKPLPRGRYVVRWNGERRVIRIR